MKTYKLTFRSLSTMSRLPDAQVIFGAICRIIEMTQGIEALQRYFDSFSDTPLFVHSSMFPDGLLPMVKVGLLTIKEKNQQIFSKDPQEQLSYLSTLKQYKGIQYVEEVIFKKYLIPGLFEELKEDLFSSQLCLSQGIIFEQNIKNNDMMTQLVFHNNLEDPLDERKLYYDQTIYVQPHALFNVYVKTDDIDYVKKIMKYSAYVGFGNKISVGKNSFECVKIEEMKPLEQLQDHCILLSKCLDTQFDFEQSSYMIESKSFSGSHACRGELYESTRK